VVSTVGVSAYDIGGFLLRLTRNTVSAGNLTVFFRNHDVSDHNLWIESPGGLAVRISDTVGENGGASRTLPVTAGAWRLFCALPDHDAMTRTLTVTPEVPPGTALLPQPRRRSPPPIVAPMPR